MKQVRFGWMGWVVLVGTLGMGCSGETAKKLLGDGCTINSDCSGSLMCSFGRCHAACVTSKDCPTGQSCVKDSSGNAVCQLPAETKCTTDRDCGAPLICGADGQCRSQCTKDSDCTSGQKCSTNNTCAEPNQVNSSGNLIAPDGGVIGAGGNFGAGGTGSTGGATAPAVGSTGCTTGEERCACFANNTCFTGLTCASQICVNLGTGGTTSAGGATSTGGATNTGGTAATGGVISTGGIVSTGGAAAAGGITSTGGSTPTGGTVSTSTKTATGGTIANGSANTGGTLVSAGYTGGATATGGSTSAGGTSFSGGATSTGGSANVCDISAATVALFHFDETDGGESLVDSSGTGKVATIHGNSQISTARSVFGGASLYINGDSTAHVDYVLVDTAAGLDLTFPGDYTMDWWQYLISYTNTFGWIVGICNSAPEARDYTACTGGAAAGWNSGASFCYPDYCPMPATSSWHHIALTRAGSTFRMFVDGVLLRQADSSSTAGGRYLSVSGAPCEAPGASDNGDFNGYIDELRVVKGCAVWTSNFTPPTLPY